jgi:Co/Zn/Cd efflux system component
MSQEEKGGIQRSLFAVPQMDCPSEENLIRMALDDLGEVLSLDFDLSGRRLTVVHRGEAAAVLRRLEPLGLGAELLASEGVAETEVVAKDPTEDAAEAKVLKTLLAINGGMFVVEMAIGLAAQSTGLIADSLDMFADAAVYGVALYAVGGAARLKMRAARFAGWLQLALALGALAEVLRRFLYGSEPVSALMMGMGLVALAANVSALMLIARKRDRGAHMQASYIFSANDVIANLGVIVAGALVAFSGSRLPDLIVGTVISLIVLHGARRILRLK